MVDIRELARRSGVSAATGSRRRRSTTGADVSPAPPARASLELAAELGYFAQPAGQDVGAQAIRHGRTDLGHLGTRRTGRRHPLSSRTCWSP